VYSAFRILMGAWTLAFSHYFLPVVWNFMPSDLKNFPILDMLHGIYVVTFLYALAAGIAGIVAAWSLQQRKPWGRTMALIIAFISMINIPFGTALGVYTVIVLLPSAAGQDYQRIAVPA